MKLVSFNINTASHEEFKEKLEVTKDANFYTISKTALYDMVSGYGDFILVDDENKIIIMPEED